METHKEKSRFALILILGLLSAIGPFSIDMYLPAFPVIAKGLHTNIEQVQLSLSSFFIGISLGQLAYGPLLDRYGRKKPLYVGIIIYLLASAGCAMAASVNQLILLRFLQALGACVGIVASRAMIRDLFPVKESAKVFSLLLLVIAISPMIAPTVGGYVTAAFGWHAVFIALAIVAALIFIAVHFYLPESRQPDPGFSLKPKPIINNFLSVIKEPQFYTYALAGCIGAAGQYAYISGSPYVFIELFHVSEKHYGWLFACNAAGLIGFSQLNSVLLKKYTSQQLIGTLQLVQAGVVLIAFAGAFFGWLTLPSTCFLLFCFLSLQGIIFPNASALSIAPFSSNAGSASALLGAIQMGCGALASAAVSIFANNSAIPMTGVIAFCTCTSLVIIMIAQYRIKNKTSALAVEEQVVERGELS
jgi:DHA1 family bicyclomycin/chloramphenicol resistance-like MFS transporter